MKKYFTLLILLLSFGVSAEEASPQGTIKRLIAYSKYGNGDVYVELTQNGATCSSGYYIDKASAGYESTLSMLLAAYQANTPVTIFAYENKRWAGSSYAVCEISSVVYMR
ncbi:hypothetical protein [Vibrio europaeus]|uniref:hypothetical protein n=1 Tax=Vibrio europaeus TaxID=300876 RepID=UPI00233EA818|nr:hypothetical protein [Vibrio europaeus]MDC5855186.1 hypothetical protein [Vibrio europaeus]